MSAQPRPAPLSVRASRRTLIHRTALPSTGMPSPFDSPVLLYDLDEAAAVLRISRRQLQRLRAAGDLPATRIGSRAVVRRSDLDAYVAGLSESAA